MEDSLEDQDRSVATYYNESAQNYDKDFEAPYFKELYDKVTWHYIEPYLPSEGTVLDAGGGTGRWTIPIARRGLRVVLYDISREMLAVARRKTEECGLTDLVTTEEGDICNMPFGNDEFDFVLAEGDPISHCGNPDKATSEIARVLKRDRYMAVGVDSLFNVIRGVLEREGPDLAMKALLDKRFYANYAKPWRLRCWAFSPDDLRKLFERNGLEVVKIVGKTLTHRSKSRDDPLLQDPDRAKKLLELELMLCEEPSIVGFGWHLHAVGRKRAEIYSK